jgi:hypothetical protein
MRFAKLENNIIAVFWLAMFDYEVVDANGNPTTEIPRENINGFTAQKPRAAIHLKFTVRE